MLLAVADASYSTWRQKLKGRGALLLIVKTMMQPDHLKKIKLKKLISKRENEFAR